LVNRDQFIRNGLLTTKIFLNAAGFLRITQESDLPKPPKSRHNEDADVPDPLDNTRIHPEDYELARKMATDALELDEEDVHDEHPSHVVTLIMNDPDNEKKLDELNLDDFAVNMYESNQDKKRWTLVLIRQELTKPFKELRKDFELPKDWEVLTMLSGETRNTLRVGLIVSAQVTRLRDPSAGVRLDSGIEGSIQRTFIIDDGDVRPRDVLKQGQTLQCVIMNTNISAKKDIFTVDLSCRPSDVAAGDSQYRRVKHDEAWNHVQYDRDAEVQARKKRAEVEKTRRIIKHPNFQNFNAAQAEQYLDRQQRGDVVIRPSSKGATHIAVTWKVDDKLFQHIGTS
jgi:transcription elongation factor SPT6